MNKQFINIKELPGIPIYTVLDCISVGLGHTTKFGTAFIGRVENFPDFFAPVLEEANGFKVGDKVKFTATRIGTVGYIETVFKINNSGVFIVNCNGEKSCWTIGYFIKVNTLPTTIGEVQKLLIHSGDCHRTDKEIAYSNLLQIADALNGDWKPNYKDTAYKIYRTGKDLFGSYEVTHGRYGNLLTVYFKSKELAQHVIDHFSDILKQLI